MSVYFLGEDEQHRMQLFETEPNLILDFEGPALGKFVQYKPPSTGKHVKFSLSREDCAPASLTPMEYVDMWLQVTYQKANGEPLF